MHEQHSDREDRPEGWWKTYRQDAPSTGVVREVMDRIQAGMDEAERHEDGATVHAALDAVLDLLGDEHHDPLTTPLVVGVCRVLRTVPRTSRGGQDEIDVHC